MFLKLKSAKSFILRRSGRETKLRSNKKNMFGFLVTNRHHEVVLTRYQGRILLKMFSELLRLQRPSNQLLSPSCQRPCSQTKTAFDKMASFPIHPFQGPLHRHASDGRNFVCNLGIMSGPDFQICSPQSVCPGVTRIVSQVFTRFSLLSSSRITRVREKNPSDIQQERV